MEEVSRAPGNEEAGQKGGAMPAYAPGYAVPTAAEWMLGRVRWSGVWAGFVTATALALWLVIIGYAIFPPTVVSGPGGGSLISGPSTGFYVWSAIGYLVALFVGGVLLSLFGGIRSSGDAIGNGAVLWGVNFTLLLAFLGIGGRLFMGPAVTPIGPAAVTSALAASVTTAWWFVLFQLLALGAAIGGAITGIRTGTETAAPG